MQNIEENEGGKIPGYEKQPEESREKQKKYGPGQILIAFYLISIIISFWVVAKTPKPKIVKRGKDGIISSISRKKGVAVISVTGAIYQRASGSIWDIDIKRKVAEKIKRMSRKKEVKAILLDINSPGGTVSAVQDIYSAILRAKKETKKPFVARIGDVAASGAYYVAAACDKIVANPGSITGSIGVIFSAGNWQGLMKKLGIEAETIKSGKYKDIGSPVRKMTKEERKLLQDMIDDAYSQFLDAVVKGRNIPKEKLESIADGRIFTGRQALAKGLVDKLGDFQTALDLAGEMAKLGKDPPVIRSTDAIEEFFSIINIKSNILGKLEGGYLQYPSLQYIWKGF